MPDTTSPGSSETRTAKAFAFLSLFSSFGTLICCALPALLVAVGLGAAVAGAVSAVPQLIWLSERKGWVFGVAGTLLGVAGLLRWNAARLACPVDPVSAAACRRARDYSSWVYGIAVTLYLIGAAVAFGPAVLGGR